jgi:DNA-binding response OmpR family regulator
VPNLNCCVCWPSTRTACCRATTSSAWLKGYERDAFDRSIDVRVTRLRRKIEADPAHPQYIRTVRGEGYLFNPKGEA